MVPSFFGGYFRIKFYGLRLLFDDFWIALHNKGLLVFLLKIEQLLGNSIAFRIHNAHD